MRLALMSVGLVVVMGVGCADDDPPSLRTLCETQHDSPNRCTPACSEALGTVGSTACADEVAAVRAMGAEYDAMRACLSGCPSTRDCMGIGEDLLDCDCLQRCVEARSQELQDAVAANQLCFERATATECL